MTATSQNSPEALCAEILAAARRESDDLLQQAKAEAGKIIAGAVAEAEKIQRERRERAQVEAGRRKEVFLATLAVETGRLRTARVEGVLESVHREIRRRLQVRDLDTRETVVALATAAIRRMPGNDYDLKISAADSAAFGDALPGEIERRVGRSPLNVAISPEATMAERGVIIQTADGFQIWDNQLSPRLERLWPELRRQIAVRASLVGESRSRGGGA